LFHHILNPFATPKIIDKKNDTYIEQKILEKQKIDDIFIKQKMLEQEEEAKEEQEKQDKEVADKLKSLKWKDAESYIKEKATNTTIKKKSIDFKDAKSYINEKVSKNTSIKKKVDVSGYETIDDSGYITSYNKTKSKKDDYLGYKTSYDNPKTFEKLLNDSNTEFKQPGILKSNDTFTTPTINNNNNSDFYFESDNNNNNNIYGGGEDLFISSGTEAPKKTVDKAIGFIDTLKKESNIKEDPFDLKKKTALELRNICSQLGIKIKKEGLNKGYKINSDLINDIELYKDSPLKKMALTPKPKTITKPKTTKKQIV